MKKHKRDPHSIKADQTIHHEELDDTRPSDKAKERFRRPAYQLTDPVGYMAKKYDIEKGLDE